MIIGLVETPGIITISFVDLVCSSDYAIANQIILKVQGYKLSGGDSAMFLIEQNAGTVIPNISLTFR